MRDIVSSIQAEQDLVIRAPAASVTEVEGGPGTGKTAVALHRAAYLLYQDRRRYAGGILIVSPDPAAGRLHRGRAALARRGGPGRHPRARLAGGRRGGRRRTTSRPWPASRAPARMLKVLRKAAARGALELGRQAPQPPAGRRLRQPASSWRPTSWPASASSVLGGTAPVNLLRPRARKLLLDALWAQSGAAPPPHGPGAGRRAARGASTRTSAPRTTSSRFLDAWWPELTPRGGRWPRMADERPARPLGAPAVAQPRRGAPLARSLHGSTPTARARCPCTTWRCWTSCSVLLGTPARPAQARAGPAGPAHRPGGADHRQTARRRSRERAERLAEERTEYAHVIVDEAQDLTPMQWRMVGRRGRHATWTVVGDPAQSLLVRPGRGGRGPRRGAGHPPAPPLRTDRQLPQPR